MTMLLKSSAFSDGAKIPRRFTCDGEDLSPPLEWTGAPAAMQSFVLLCDDPDAPSGTWHHWAAYDIPPTRKELVEGAAGQAERQGFKQATNDFRRVGYGGPCPPRGHGSHHYNFRLLAISVRQLAIRPNATCVDVESEARKHLLEEAELTGTYSR
jgi:Raf kinase inhibitor-like YbhB/YbcL family protein